MVLSPSAINHSKFRILKSFVGTAYLIGSSVDTKLIHPEPIPTLSKGLRTAIVAWMVGWFPLDRWFWGGEVCWVD